MNNAYDYSMLDFIEHYSGIMYDRNLKSFGNLITKNDIINEVMTKQCDTKDESVKTVRNVIFLERRRMMALQQQKHGYKPITGRKLCKKCGQIKSVQEFYVRFDKRIGFRYLSNCKECERKRRTNYNQRKRNEKLQSKKLLVA